MKQLLLQNCILLDEELYFHEGKLYTVKTFLELLKERGTMKSVKKKILRDYGKRFRDKSEVLAYMAGVARGL